MEMILSSVSISVHQWLNALSSFRYFRVFRGPLVFTFKSVGEIHSTMLMTKAIQRASRAMLESVFATKITKVTKVWRKWGIITTKYPEKYEKGGERLIGDNSPYRVRGFQAWDNPLT